MLQRPSSSASITIRHYLSPQDNSVAWDGTRDHESNTLPLTPPRGTTTELQNNVLIFPSEFELGDGGSRHIGTPSGGRLHRRIQLSSVPRLQCWEVSGQEG